MRRKFTSHRPYTWYYATTIYALLSTKIYVNVTFTPYHLKTVKKKATLCYVSQHSHNIIVGLSALSLSLCKSIFNS